MHRSLWTFVLLSLIASHQVCQAEDEDLVEDEDIVEDKRVVCKHGWKEFKGNCYFITEYHVSRRYAETWCKRYGYGMAVIKDQETNNFIAKMGESLYDSAFWLGLNDKQTEGRFFWDDGQAMTYSNWNRGEPNSVYEDCVTMYLKSPNAGKWNDDRCYRQYRGVCQQLKEGDTSAAGDASGCLPGWKKFGKNCYLMIANYANWITAKTECENLGYSLVNIQDKATNDFVVSLASTAKYTSEIFIGANDMRWEFHFYWAGGSKLSYTNWRPGKPDQSGDCVKMTLQGPNRGTWTDGSCFDYEKYICQQFPS